MKLSATPFHPTSGQLLPAYRDAYLRGDLSGANTALVDAYLKANAQTADETLRRFHELQSKGHAVKPLGWVQRQFDLIRTEPERFRRRAAGLVMGGALLGSAVFAGNRLPVAKAPALAGADAVAAEATALRTVAVRGRILDENGKPLVGATIWQKGTRNGVSTDANGNYTMRMPAGQPATLQYGYAGYAEEEMTVVGGRTENVTLVPRDTDAAPQKKHRFLFF
ncbi:carboxypeptidase-like regulatory domain-containing protein [Hymenobacter sp. 15J16-1T3B]|uniref:carboxypeptidase-like regulatory domain-containing protein n=1 Tax=Hymenobacter sp. 15J16-1T3B TaxID=2886941 RepID=UPI001D10675D|nr:carboxypeptidase-like regulatory domain-containing protein [Hymenobacter sp. 15J16-1T3B]MCC3157031.1 carboxypeptidase-like regulatory domain-containing protein [Hymenobacter sp. 15J16-1T3B]